MLTLITSNMWCVVYSASYVPRIYLVFDASYQHTSSSFVSWRCWSWMLHLPDENDFLGIESRLCNAQVTLFLWLFHPLFEYFSVTKSWSRPFRWQLVYNLPPCSLSSFSIHQRTHNVVSAISYQKQQTTDSQLTYNIKKLRSDGKRVNT